MYATILREDQCADCGNKLIDEGRCPLAEEGFRLCGRREHFIHDDGKPAHTGCYLCQQLVDFPGILLPVRKP